MAKKQQTVPRKPAARRSISLGATAMAVSVGMLEEVPIADGFKTTVNGLVIDGDPGFDAWAQAGQTLRVVEKGAQFAIGDFVLYGEAKYGEQAAQVLDASDGWSLSTIRNYAWLAERIPASARRMDRLGIRHHQLVASLSAAKQRDWLERAAADEEEQPWTVARLKAAIESGEDAAPTAFYVLVTCETLERQKEILARLETQGLKCKAIEKRKKPKQ